MYDTEDWKAFVRAEVVRRHEDTPVHLPVRNRQPSASSVVYSIRLDPGEVAALESRAKDAGIQPTVLARNLIRTGLTTPRGDALPRAIDQVQAAVEELRSLVS